MRFWQEFPGPNAGYVLELYNRFLENPDAVDEHTQTFFKNWAPPDGQEIPAVPSNWDVKKIAGAVNYAQAIRVFGHLRANIDPLGREQPHAPMLDPATYNLTTSDLKTLPASLIDPPPHVDAADAHEATQALCDIYIGTTGYDYEHIRIPEKRSWLQAVIEERRYRPPSQPIDDVGLLRRLSRVEVFEQFLHRIYPGMHRFSIEGLDMMVPMLDEVVRMAAEQGPHQILIGMAHRGRLNVLTHVLEKPYAQILAEFKDPVGKRTFRQDLGWTGDVKYHQGARHTLNTSQRISVTMPPNPSHVEAIDPVLLGMARAAGTSVDRAAPPRFDPGVILPLLIHGDAAFAGQGIVAETFNLSRLPGYWVGGTIHIIANNQLGYTTSPEDARSTLYASDLAKGFKFPILHVNADDPEACIEAVRLAFAYRAEFARDIVIDLLGYRRYGHNEGDEPRFTQPMMYQIIDDHPTVRELWARTLIERGVIEADEAEVLVKQIYDELKETFNSLEPDRDLQEMPPMPPPPGLARQAETGVPLERLQALNESLLRVPDGFHLHPKIQRVMQRRAESQGDPDVPAVDWASAEDLALGTILEDGIAVRMTGEDTERGTFNQRHAVFHDVKTGETYKPLANIPDASATYEIHDSPLSESAALGFEYGYNIEAPQRLVLWEAQYGDFINNAQMIVDEFIVSARAKWGQTPSLVLLLPHALEGAGPDHSSGRLERFLQLAAETNMRITNPTSAAQYFHLLRRQASLLESDPLPLVIMTPKSLLRHERMLSSMRSLAEGRWQPVINDDLSEDHAAKIHHLLLCSGKVCVDLETSELRPSHSDVAVVRVEQLYPFPTDELAGILDGYPNLEDVAWVQEEPQNMGAWEFVYPHLVDILNGQLPLRYVGREPSSSPGEGSMAWYTANQALLIEQAYGERADDNQEDFILMVRKQ